MIVECCPELGRYYYTQVKKALLCKQDIKLQSPSWGYHISAIRGESLSDPEAIAKYTSANNTQIEFKYTHEVLSNGRYFWVPVECESLLDLREALGLPRKPYFNFHLTIAVNALSEGSYGLVEV